MYSNAGLNRIISFLNTDITHIGIGISATPIDPTNVLLNTELQRKAVTSLIDGFTLVLDGFWDETEGNGFTYTEAGVFGDGATATINTGTLFAGGAISVAKDNTQSLTISIEIILEAI